MANKKELSKEDQEALDRYNNYVAKMGKNKEIKNKNEEPIETEKISKIKETTIKAPEGASEEDKKALERYNNYIARNNKKKWKMDNNLNENKSTVKIEDKKSDIKAPQNAKKEDKEALDRYNKFVSNQMMRDSKRRKKKKNILQKDISSVAWKIRLVFLILAVSFFLWALKGQIFGAM